MKLALIRGLIAGPLVLLACGVCAYAQQKTFVYTNNSFAGPNTVSAFSVATDGRLTQLPGSPYATGGTGDGGGGIDPDRVVVVGERLYAGNDASHNISGFAISPSTGALTPLPGSPYSFAPANFSADISMAASADGRLLFATDSWTRAVASFSIGTDGALSLVSQLGPYADEPRSCRPSPDGKRLVVPFFQNEVRVYDVAPAGTLSEVVGSPFPAVAPGTSNPESADFTCGGDVLYVGAQSVNTVLYGFSVGADGSLAMLPGFPLLRNDQENTIEVVTSADSRYLFVGGAFSSTVGSFAIGANGALTPVPGSPFALPTNTFISQGLTTDASGRYVFTSSFSPVGVVVYRVGANGALTLVPGSPFLTGIPANNQGNPAVYPAKNCRAATSGSVCYADDATGDTFSEVVDRTSPLYGSWTYRVAATGQSITGVANSVSYTPGRSLISSDTDYSPENRTYSMTANVSYASNSGTVKVVRRGSNEQHILRDRNLADDGPCF